MKPSNSRVPTCVFINGKASGKCSGSTVVSAILPPSYEGSSILTPAWTSGVFINSITHYWPTSIEFRSNGDAHPMYMDSIEYLEAIHEYSLSPESPFRWLENGASALSGQFEVKFTLVATTGGDEYNYLRLYDGAEMWRTLNFDSISTLNNPSFFNGDAVIPYADIDGYIYSGEEPTITVLMEIREVNNPLNIISGELFTKQGQVGE